MLNVTTITTTTWSCQQNVCSAAYALSFCGRDMHKRNGP